MEDEEKSVGADEQTSEEEDEQEESQDVLTTVNAAWEERERKMREEYERRIAERDALIAQLIRGENNTEAADGIVDKVNSRRQYKKW